MSIIITVVDRQTILAYEMHKGANIMSDETTIEELKKRLDSQAMELKSLHDLLRDVQGMVTDMTPDVYRNDKRINAIEKIYMSKDGYEVIYKKLEDVQGVLREE